ncbi:putative T7SS-secreted protein [Lapillicoccus jejuensis]|uniref:Putative T7SS secretion signal domain-containing protein n=1 Tax=Lapillicoccus jejuensis TaxID=402171 RepID=A0A542DV95_9MICO|nr:hypothetical protein [Lapillicoccus jejuensis]TQJ07019.1 hypothetical protein FB458_0065 [Lapillicoccus jejuensis]
MDGTEEPALASGASVDELVAGSVTGILGLAEAMASLGDGLDDSATALSRVEVTGWYGVASAAAHDRLGQESSRWVAASGAFTTAGEALRRYAAALAPARALAGEAVAAYRRYLALVDLLVAAVAVPSTGGTTPVSGSGKVAASVPDRAQVGHRTAVLLAAAHGEDAQLAYDADSLRRRAISLLADARAQALAAGDAAADQIQAAIADAPRARTFWQGTIRRPGAEDAGHTSLDVVGFVPGWVGMAATAVNVGWYALEGDREDAGYAAMGFAPFGMGKVGHEIAAGSRVFRLTDKADVLALTGRDLSQLAPSLGLTEVSPGVFTTRGGLTLELIGGQHRVPHVLLHLFPDATKRTHSVFNVPAEELFSTLDEAWARRGAPEANDPLAYVIDLHRAVGVSGETKVRIVVRTIGSVNRVVTAFPC